MLGIYEARPDVYSSGMVLKMSLKHLPFHADKTNYK